MIIFEFSYKMFFLFQGEIIKAGAENNFIMNKGNLIIQNVQRNSAGDFFYRIRCKIFIKFLDSHRY